ncbi:hypothetical protein ETD83_03060 [Actinomadura soli]|uniref:Uncharacterized protein n=1 Tax=Actinomadura soli TaxID=2508997 RepID=A0A5C4JJS1_9ACTN|nr:hypothetical protein [Actinomadura soli]TMR06871.1 hypothetical protein ETD83_03060 [Actinomadura soli]
MNQPLRRRPDQPPAPVPVAAGAPAHPAPAPGPASPGGLDPSGFLGMAEAPALLGAGPATPGRSAREPAHRAPADQ